MKKKILYAMLAAILLPFALFTPGRAQENETPSGRVSGDAAIGGDLEKRVSSIRMKGVSLAQFLSVVSSQTGVSFTIADDIADSQVTVFLRKSSLGEVIELLKKTKDLEFRSSGASRIYRVSRSTTPFEAFAPLTRNDIENPLLQRVVAGVRLKEAPLNVFLEVVSAKAKVNFMVVDNAQDIRITTFIDKTTVADILLFLRGKGLSYSRVGDSSTFVIRRLERSTDSFVKAEAAFRDAKYEEAVRLYKKVAEQYPDSEMADYALLKAAVSYDWIAARDNAPAALKEEEKLLRRLIKDYPKSQRLGDAYLYLGQIYSGYGGAKTQVDCGKAIELYGSAIKNTYRDWVKAQAAVRTGQCYEVLGDKAKAAALYETASKDYPDEEIVKSIAQPAKADGAFLYGERMRKGTEAFIAMSYADAVREFEGAVSQDKASSVAWTRLGSAYFMAGNKEAAKKAYKKALELDPGNKNVQQFIESHDLK